MLVDKKRYLLREEEDALRDKYCLQCTKPFCAFCDTEVEDADIVQPVRKKGTWGADGECPFCGYLRQWDDDNFCGNCGADMRGDSNE